ncbi:MAG TPA: sugar phosphate nucleotidyltransferase [Allosphingosinicella sp.]|nr:sugar phosphate nucleotidyltransferase [Allosphingosinicella sp.]
MRAVILAGGKGTRLMPLTENLPKPLVPVGGVPILEIIVRQLRHFGITDLTLSVGHLHGLLESHFGNGSGWDIGIDYSHEADPLGTAGPIALVERLSNPFLVLNGDLLCSMDYGALIEVHRASGASVTIASYPKEVKIELGVLETDGDRLIDYVEKPVIPYRVSMGIYAMSPEVVGRIPKGQRFDLPDLIKRLIAEGEWINLYRFDGYWRDIGTMDEYAAANEEFPAVRPSLNID